MSCLDFNSLDLPSRVNVFDKGVEFVLLVVQEDSLVLESKAQLAVLETLGDVFCDSSFSELEVVWEAFDSTDQEDKSKDLGRLDFIATLLSRVPMR
jgi:hypothetical protein